MSKARTVFFWITGIALLLIALILFFFSSFTETTYSIDSLPEQVSSVGQVPEAPPVISHLSTPEPLKAIYMTSCVAGTPSWRTSLKALIERTELNAVVIDIKDYTGRVSFPNTFPKSSAQRGCTVSDLQAFIAELHQSNIYVIGRISVFQDLSYSNLFPEFAVKSLSTGGVWQDHKGISFIDVGATPYWDYIIEISKKSYELGFDELNYDYVRYPSDGVMKDASYTWTQASSTRAQTLQNFFSYLHDHLKDTGVKTSVDLFGMTTTIFNDMGIGQVLEYALPYFDYVSPMVYPSHYPPSWNGFANPAEYPYDVIKFAMSAGVAREQALNIARGIATSTPSKLRPWLQDFNLGATYGPDKVRAQMQATYDSGLTSWMLWSAANKYTEAALLTEN
jgi:hypothetical protein